MKCVTHRNVSVQRKPKWPKRPKRATFSSSFSWGCETTFDVGLLSFHFLFEPFYSTNIPDMLHHLIQDMDSPNRLNSNLCLLFSTRRSMFDLKSKSTRCQSITKPEDLRVALAALSAFIHVAFNLGDWQVLNPRLYRSYPPPEPSVIRIFLPSTSALRELNEALVQCSFLS